MFRVLIEEAKNDVVLKRIDIPRITTEKVQNLIGRYFLKYKVNKQTFSEDGYYEYEFTELPTDTKAVATVSFWRFSKEDTTPMKNIKELNKHESRQAYKPPYTPPVIKPEEPKEERIQEMFDAGLLTKSHY